jgi:hypothetical protein
VSVSGTFNSPPLRVSTRKAVRMAFREVPVFEVRELLRLWLDGRGLRSIEAVVPPDRKTIRRVVDVAVGLGLDRAGGDGQLSDEFLSLVMAALVVRRPDRHGESWAVIAGHHDTIAGWVADQVPVVKMGELLERRGVVVAERTLHRYVAERFGPSLSGSSTVPVADCDPGAELQIDWAKLGLVFDAESGRRRTVWALLFTSVFSRHCFVWLSHTQALDAVIAGCDAAWEFFGGVFKVVIPDNMKTIVTRADGCDPQLCQAFVEYAQWAGFFVDPARVRAPQDKARVERNVRFLKDSFWAGETFADLVEAQAAVEGWCRARAGMRTHGTTAKRPVEVFNEHEAPVLAAAPGGRYDLPIYRDAKVARDHHVQVAKALYSVPGGLIGQTVAVRADSKLVKIYARGVLVKTHARVPVGHRSTDAEDLPADKTIYAMRDIDRLIGDAAGHGTAVGAFARVVLDHPLPWTKMRQVYKLLGLCRRYGDDRVDAACIRALDAETDSVTVVGRMLERALEAETTVEDPVPDNVIRGRFARDDDHFAVAPTGVNR